MNKCQLNTSGICFVYKNLSHYNQHECDRKEQRSHDLDHSKSEDIVLLEKQGKCSQKIRNNAVGNLAEVTHTVGHNMTDISNIGNISTQKVCILCSTWSHFATNHCIMCALWLQASLQLPDHLKQRGVSLPPRALPRPQRSLKPPRKVEYDRLSDSQIKAHSQTPPKIITPSTYEMRTSSLKRDEYPKCKFSTSSTYMEMKQALGFPKSPFSLKPKDYGSINKSEFSKPEYTSKKNYSRLEGSPRPKMPEASGFKRSLLPTVRKYSQAIYPVNKSSRESLNSSGSNNSSNAYLRRSPNPNQANHPKGDSGSSVGQHNYSRMLLKPTNIGQMDQKSMLYQHQIQSASRNNYVSASLPPKPGDRCIKGSLKDENRYRIQF